MHITHDLVQEAENILFHNEKDIAQGIRCLQ